MPKNRKTIVSTSRLQQGSAILAAARALDTKLIKDRLAVFERAQKAGAEAQARVDAADSALRTAQAQLAELDLDQDEAVEALALALANDGQPRTTPFAAFGAPSPAALIKQPFAQEAASIHSLVATIKRSKAIGKTALQAAQAAEKAAHAVEQAMGPIAKLQEASREARQMRDALSQSWETALAALRRGARAAMDDGGHHLYAALFAGTTRTTRRKASGGDNGSTESQASSPPATTA